MKSKTITVEHEVEVYYETVRSVEGSDEDGNRGMVSVEWAPRSAEVLTRVQSKDIEAYLIACAIDQFNEAYNS